MSSPGIRALRASGRNDLAEALEALMSAVADEAARNAAFADALTAALGSSTGAVTEAAVPRRRAGKRAPGPFDPFALYAEGEDVLRSRLGACDVDELKDIVAEHGMDHDRLALKWKSPERLIERIVDTVTARTHKGDAFRAPSAGRP